MKSWMEERDLLIARTMAFVQEVGASTPTRAKAQIVSAPTGQIQKSEQPIAIEHQPIEAPPEPTGRLTALPTVDERAEITNALPHSRLIKRDFSRTGIGFSAR